MSVIAIYRFRGTFQVKSEHEAEFPGGVERDGMLFLRQAADERSDAAASTALATYDVADAAILGYGLLKMEVLELDEYKDFAAQHEKALREGSALVYYPS